VVEATLSLLSPWEGEAAAVPVTTFNDRTTAPDFDPFSANDHIDLSNHPRRNPGELFK
jgi:hypothetical protein